MTTLEYLPLGTTLYVDDLIGNEKQFIKPSDLALEALRREIFIPTEILPMKKVHIAFLDHRQVVPDMKDPGLVSYFTKAV